MYAHVALASAAPSSASSLSQQGPVGAGDVVGGALGAAGAARVVGVGVGGDVGRCVGALDGLRVGEGVGGGRGADVGAYVGRRVGEGGGSKQKPQLASQSPANSASQLGQNSAAQKPVVAA